MWIRVKEFVWWDAPLALWDLAITIRTISMASSIIDPSLVTTTIPHFLVHSQVFKPSNKWLQISLHLSLWLWIPCYHSLTTPCILKTIPSPYPFDFLALAVDLRIIFPPLGLDKEILTSPHSLTPPLTSMGEWNEILVSTYILISLSKPMNKMMSCQATMG